MQYYNILIATLHSNIFIHYCYLQIYFWRNVLEFCDQYNKVISFVGADHGKDLKEIIAVFCRQVNNFTSILHYFWNSGIENNMLCMHVCSQQVAEASHGNWSCYDDQRTLDRGQKHVKINIWINKLHASAHYEFGKDIVYELINFTRYLRNHEEFMSSASNQISRLSDMSNPIQVKNENVDYIWLANGA
jgi:hypothetical protein